MTSRHIVVLGLVFIVLVGLVIWYAPIRVLDSSLIKDKTRLESYLEGAKIYHERASERGRVVKALKLVSHEEYVHTNECIAPPRGNILFCFSTHVSWLTLTIDIYPNSEAIRYTEPMLVERMLAINIKTLLEYGFGIKPDKATLIMGEREGGGVLKW